MYVQILPTTVHPIRKILKKLVKKWLIQGLLRIANLLGLQILEKISRHRGAKQLVGCQLPSLFEEMAIILRDLPRQNQSRPSEPLLSLPGFFLGSLIWSFVI